MLIIKTLLLWFVSIPLWAGPPEVVEVQISPSGADTYRFDVTVRHADEGWDHYADRFEILTDDGAVLGTRVLYHPHENEQPFTRSLSGVELGRDLEQVQVRAHDSVHGYGEPPMSIAIPR